MRALHRAKVQMFIILFLSFTARILISWLPFDWLLVTLLTDDAFYYFKIAANTVKGLGVSFDGLSPTNGFHPLWLAIILPLFAALGEDKILVIRAVLSVAAVLDTAAIYVLYKICADSLSLHHTVSLAVAILYGFNPWILLSDGGTLNGVETAANVFFVLLFLRTYFDTFKSGQVRPLRLGLVSGATLLARTDNAILVACCFIFALWQYRGCPLVIRQWIAAAPVAGLVIFPFFLWSFSSVGTVVQTSAVSLPVITKTLLSVDRWSIADRVAQYVKNLLNLGIAMGIPVRSKTEPLFILCLTAGGAVATTLGLIWWKHRGQQGVRQISSDVRFAVLLLMIVMMFVGAHTLRAVYLRPWYYTPLVPMMLLAIGIVLNQSVLYLPLGRRLVMVTFAILLALFTVGVVRTAVWPPLPEARDLIAALETIRPVLPPGSRVGSFNAGIIGYFLDGATVVNLDGVVNNRVYPYLRRRELDIYIRAAQLEYIMEGADLIPKVKAHLMRDQEWARRWRLVSRYPGRHLTIELWAVPRE